MKFYTLKMSGGKTQFCHPYVSAESPWHEEDLYIGEYKQIHDLPIPYEVTNKYKPDDFMNWHAVLVSPKLKTLFASVCKGAEFLPSQMYYKGEAIHGERFTAMFPAFDALNYEESEIDWDFHSGIEFLYSIEDLVLSLEKCEKIPDDEGVFYLQEKKTNHLLASEKAKEKIEKSNVTGITFIELK